MTRRDQLLPSRTELRHTEPTIWSVMYRSGRQIGLKEIITDGHPVTTQLALQLAVRVACGVERGATSQTIHARPAATASLRIIVQET